MKREGLRHSRRYGYVVRRESNPQTGHAEAAGMRRERESAKSLPDHFRLRLEDSNHRPFLRELASNAGDREGDLLAHLFFTAAERMALRDDAALLSTGPGAIESLA